MQKANKRILIKKNMKDDIFNNDNRKHFDYLQSIISRMAANSFMIKGWTITIVSALLALAASNKEPLYLYVTFIPIIIFGFLDAYYLQLERKFRSLFKEVTKASTTIDCFSTDISIKEVKEVKKNRYFYVLRSGTISCFYLPLFVVMVLFLKYIPKKTTDDKTKVEVSISDTLKVKEIDKRVHWTFCCDTCKKR